MANHARKSLGEIGAADNRAQTLVARASLMPWLLGPAALLLTAFVLHAIHRLLVDVRYAEIVAAVGAIPSRQLALALAAMAVSYAALTAYDGSALRYAGATVARSTVALTAFIAFAISNTIGLGVLSGGAVRLRLYTAAGLLPAQVGRAIAFNAGAFALGIAVFGAVGLGWTAPALAARSGLPAWALQGFSALVLAATAAFIAMCALRPRLRVLGRWDIALPGPGLVARQLLICAVDLSAAAATLWVLLPAGAIAFPDFIAFYAVAVALGLASHVPGGLGVFEAVMLYACAGRLPAEQVVGALLLYRVIYHLLPLTLAVLLLAIYEARAAAAAPVVRAAARLLPAMMAAMTVIAGCMLLVSGVTPAADEAAALLALHLPLGVVEAAHLLGSVAGLAMLLVARGLLHRLDAAWWGALVLSVAGAVLALPKGLALSEAAALALCSLMLLLSRRQFDRRSRLFDQRFERGWWLGVGTVLAVCVWILLFAYRDVDYAHELWWQFEFDAHAPRSLRALMAVALLAFALALAQLLRVPPGRTRRPQVAELERALAIIDAQASAEAGLALMGDKSLMFSDSGSAFVMYGRQGRSWIALFDPVGPAAEWPELVWRFMEQAHAHNGRAAFYQVRPHTLPLYLDAGMRVYKLGEAAHVELSDFTLQGPRRANLRHAVNRAQREGLSFEVLPVAALPAQMADLNAVSDAWLQAQHAHEKAFSLGNFDPVYVARQPVAIVRRDGRLIAFATLMCPASRVEASVDLMRHLPDSPAGTMDFLFTQVLLHCQGEGFQRFGLGMAPMSGMAAHPLAARWHRFGRLVFAHGERFYHFRGLRSFKDKFAPVWEARYLATQGGVAPLLVLADTASLISGDLKGVVAK